MSKSDIQIAREAKMKPIQEILDGVGVPDEAEAYSPISRYIAKIKLEYLTLLCVTVYSIKIKLNTIYRIYELD